MLVHHRLTIAFHRAHVQEPLICEMTKRFDNLMFNIHSLNVGIEEGDIRLSLIGSRDQVREAKAYFKSLGAVVKTLSSQKHTGTIPDIPDPQSRKVGSGELVEKKLWLTIIGSLKRQPFLWTIARQYDVDYKITQSMTGDNMAIVSLLVWGPPEEVNGVVSYLREQGINVEFGKVAVSAPFTPVG